MTTNNDLDIIKSDIYYLNISELKTICNLLKIDYYYYVEKEKGYFVKGRVDKKINIIKNILRAITNKKPITTIIPHNVVSFNPLIKPTANTPIYYGQYINGDKSILDLMKKLTDDKFKFGVYAQDTLLSYWKKGIALTFFQLAKRWLEYSPKLHPEWRYIDYIRTTGSKTNWHKFRKIKADNVIKLIKNWQRSQLS